MDALREPVRTLSCGHSFHTSCIDRWLIVPSRGCPFRCDTDGAASADASGDGNEVDVQLWTVTIERFVRTDGTTMFKVDGLDDSERSIFEDFEAPIIGDLRFYDGIFSFSVASGDMVRASNALRSRLMNAGYVNIQFSLH